MARFETEVSRVFKYSSLRVLLQKSCLSARANQPQNRTTITISLMKFTDLARYFIKLGCIAILLGGTHSILHEKIIPEIPESFIDPYIQPTEMEALALAQGTLLERKARFIEVQKRREEDPCWSYDLYEGMSCARLGTKVTSFTEPPSLNLVDTYQQHRNDYERDILEPFKEHAIVGLAIFFGLLYTILSFKILWAVKQWLTAQVIPSLSLRLNSFSIAKSAPNRLLKLTEDRKLRQAEKQILTLEKLRDSGLISEDEFSSRKEMLKMSLQNR